MSSMALSYYVTVCDLVSNLRAMSLHIILLPLTGCATAGVVMTLPVAKGVPNPLKEGFARQSFRAEQ